MRAMFLSCSHADPRAPTRFGALWCTAFLATCLTLLGACKYDLDKIYSHETEDAGAGDSGTVTYTNLIDNFVGSMQVDAKCAACAKKKCKTAETTCAADAECKSLVECSAQSLDPDTLADCRAQHIAWVGKDAVENWLGGPYYSCVFSESCAAECGAHGDWRCLKNYGWLKAPSSTRKVKLQVRLTDPDYNPAADVHVKVCKSDDIACNLPSAEGDSDADGNVTVELPTTFLNQFLGYLELSGNPVWYPTLVQFGWPMARNGVMPVKIVSTDRVNLLVAAGGMPTSPDRGQLQLRMFGCEGVGMRGVSFASDQTDATSLAWYFENPTASFTRTDTSDDGNGGIINVKAGANIVTATRTSDKTLVAKTTAPVRAGFLTIVFLAPLAESQ
jgi:hypothetical protein